MLKILFRRFLSINTGQKNEVFLLKISSVNVTKSEVSYGFGHIY